MFLNAILRVLDQHHSQNQAKKRTKKRRRSLRIFSAHITRNAMEIEVSAPFFSRAMINPREYCGGPAFLDSSDR
jgi:hypothetical protein